MKFKLTALFSFLLTISFTAFAQDELFKVLASKGANKVTSNNATANITIGKKLYKNDKIIVGANSYLGLAHNCGKTIEIKTAGTYEVSKLAAEVAAQNKGVCKKYVDFVIGEMTSQDEDMAKNKHKYMAVTGSVERDVKLDGNGLKTISTFIPEKAQVLNAPVTLRWVADSSIKNYVVTISDLFDEPLFKETVSEPYVNVDLNKYFRDKNKTLYLTITTPEKNAISKKIVLTCLDEGKVSELQKEINAIKEELGEETALNKFVLANVYEDKGLLVDAIAYYEAAIEMAPEVDAYKAGYFDFLIKKGLVVEPKK